MTISSRSATVVFLAILVILVSSFGAYWAFSGNSINRFNSTGSTSLTTSNCSQSFSVGQWETAYLSSNQGCATGPTPTGPWSPSGCWSSSLSEAVKFNCLSKAESPNGCTQIVHIKNSTTDFEVTVWFSYEGNHVLANGQLGNCTWNYSTALEASPPAAFCPFVNSTTFLLAEPYSTSPP